MSRGGGGCVLSARCGTTALVMAGLDRLRGRSRFGVARPGHPSASKDTLCKAMDSGSRLRQGFAGPRTSSADEALAKAAIPRMTQEERPRVPEAVIPGRCAASNSDVRLHIREISRFRIAAFASSGMTGGEGSFVRCTIIAFTTLLTSNGLSAAFSLKGAANHEKATGKQCLARLPQFELSGRIHA